MLFKFFFMMLLIGCQILNAVIIRNLHTSPVFVTAWQNDRDEKPNTILPIIKIESLAAVEMPSWNGYLEDKPFYLNTTLTADELVTEYQNDEATYKIKETFSKTLKLIDVELSIEKPKVSTPWFSFLKSSDKKIDGNDKPKKLQALFIAANPLCNNEIIISPNNNPKSSSYYSNYSKYSKLLERIKQLDVSKEAQKEAESITWTNDFRGEASKIGTTMTCLPWSTATLDNPHVEKIEQILNDSHYGLETIKNEIFDFIISEMYRTSCMTDSEKAHNSSQAPIICLAGPPGTGKTSIAIAIAKALGRKFEKISLGGLSDPNLLFGSARQWIGSRSGRFVDALCKEGTRNPVILLDEIDKIGQGGHNGSPAAMLLDILDPQQNKNFTDHYLGFGIDLSQVMFIATANDLSTIPAPLHDRMKIINLSSYDLEEKIQIAQQCILPKLTKKSFMTDKGFELSDEVIAEIINGWTMEAGIRTLEQCLKTVCAKFIVELVKTKTAIQFTPENLSKYLGPRKVPQEKLKLNHKIGVTNGLGWSPTGGSILQVEVALTPGEGKITMTGQLGEVMKESAQIALSSVRARATHYGIDPIQFKENDIHIHFPDGSTPKDGPSAGAALVSSLMSAFTGKPVNGTFAMTGEINLQGYVTAIGGLKEKALAAKRNGITNLILSSENKPDAEMLTKELSGLNVYFVDTVEEVLNHVLMPKKL